MTMYPPIRLWLDLVQAEINIFAAGDRLRFHPQSAMTDQLLKRVKACKRELLQLLAVTTPTNQLFHDLLSELVERIHQLWPAGYKLSNADWHELDTIEGRLVTSKHAGSLVDAISIAGEYERRIRNCLERDLPSWAGLP
jgi:TubC N-terminal docking domain